MQSAEEEMNTRTELFPRELLLLLLLLLYLCKDEEEHAVTRAVLTVFAVNDDSNLRNIFLVF